MSPRRAPRPETVAKHAARRADAEGPPIVRSLSAAEHAVLDAIAPTAVAPGGGPDGDARAEATRIRAELEGFLRELLGWNKDSNLVAAGDLGRLVSRHVLESLVVLPVLDRLVAASDGATGKVRLVDAGSGAGFRAIPVAIARPEWQIHAIESRRRKGLFLQRVAERMTHANFTAHIDRAERVTFAPEERAHLATARAVAVLTELLPALALLVRPGGHAVLFKGSSHGEELAAWTATKDKHWTHVETVAVPDRHLWFEVFVRTAADKAPAAALGK